MIRKAPNIKWCPTTITINKTQEELNEEAKRAIFGHTFLVREKVVQGMQLVEGDGRDVARYQYGGVREDHRTVNVRTRIQVGR